MPNRRTHGSAGVGPETQGSWFKAVVPRKRQDLLRIPSVRFGKELVMAMRFSTITLRLKIAQRPYIVWSLGPKALGYESLEPKGYYHLLDIFQIVRITASSWEPLATAPTGSKPRIMQDPAVRCRVR